MSPVLRVLLLYSAFSFCKSNTGNYFANAYLKNIEPVAQLVASIMKSEDLGTSQTNLFLSETALTATDLPAEAESSGQKPEMRAYIPLTEFRKLAASYLQTLKKQQVAGKARAELKERLRDLRMENVHRKCAMAKYFEGIDGSDLAKQYNTFSEKMFKLEKYLLEFFTSNSDEIIKVWNFDLATPQELLENLSSLAEKDNVFDQLLKKNSHSDNVFVTMYQTLRNNAILLTVSWTAYEISNDRSLLNDPQKFAEHVVNVTNGYETALNALKKANDRRDKDGFVFEKLFTNVQLSSLTGISTLPHPEKQNLFSYNENTEDFDPKYAFITARYCGEGVRFASNGRSYVNRTNRPGNCYSVFRHPLSVAPTNGSQVAMKLYNAAIPVLKTRYNHGHFNTAELIGRQLNSWDDLGLIAIFTGKDVADDLYSDQPIYKVTLHLEALSQKRDSYYSYEMVDEDINLQVTGYFLKPKDATY